MAYDCSVKENFQFAFHSISGNFYFDQHDT